MARWIVRVVLAAVLAIAVAYLVHPHVLRVLVALIVGAVVLELVHEVQKWRRPTL